jgi:hypothetical protein
MDERRGPTRRRVGVGPDHFRRPQMVGAAKPHSAAGRRDRERLEASDGLIWMPEQQGFILRRDASYPRYP